jgi:hypothetical protein
MKTNTIRKTKTIRKIRLYPDVSTVTLQILASGYRVLNEPVTRQQRIRLLAEIEARQAPIEVKKPAAASVEKRRAA